MCEDNGQRDGRHCFKWLMALSRHPAHVVRAASRAFESIPTRSVSASATLPDGFKIANCSTVVTEQCFLSNAIFFRPIPESVGVPPLINDRGRFACSAFRFACSSAAVFAAANSSAVALSAAVPVVRTIVSVKSPLSTFSGSTTLHAAQYAAIAFSYW